MQQLGKIRKSDDLRIIWPHEAKDFTSWLAKAENLSQLSDAIEIDLSTKEQESSVGSFSVDLLCDIEGSDKKAIVENQLEETNHDHLGKIITYAAGKDAEIIVWVVKHARDEHRQAIDWLNAHTDENIGFFLVELELLKIGESPWAPQFNVIASPNDWQKNAKTELSPTKTLQLKLWQKFNDYAKSNHSFTKEFKTRKALPHHWTDLALGMSHTYISLTANTTKNVITAAIYISNNKDLFASLKKHKKDIEKIVGAPLKWDPIPDKKASCILASKPANIKKNKDWNKLFDWYMDKSIKLKQAFKKYAKV